MSISQSSSRFLIRQEPVAVLGPWLLYQPQYAYTKRRGTFDAIVRVHLHFEPVSQLLGENRLDRFQRHQGIKPLPFYGGLSLSLDLSPKLSTSLIARDSTQPGRKWESFNTVVQQLYTDARFNLQVGPLEGSVTPTNGLKQGCLISPCLWSFYTLALLRTLQASRNEEWISFLRMTLRGSWTLRCQKDFLAALADLTTILETLGNYGKTAILLRLEGRQAKAVVHAHRAGLDACRFLYMEKSNSSPLKEAREYLGAQVSYRLRLDRNVKHRIQAGQAKDQHLRH